LASSIPKSLRRHGDRFTGSEPARAPGAAPLLRWALPQIAARSEPGRSLGVLSGKRERRALDRLFDADRTALLTDVVVAVEERFGTEFKIRGRTAPAITYGHSKAHRPDLKQLLFILTMSADGNIPVAFRCSDGNMSDSRTHIDTWNTLRTVAGRADFLYVADSKLCSRENMDYIDRAGGCFVTASRAVGRKKASFGIGFRSTRPTGNVAGIVPIRAIAMGRSTAGLSIGRRYHRSKAGRSCGSGAPCSLCARRADDAGTSPPPRKISHTCASGSPGRGTGDIDFEIKAILEKHYVSRYFTVNRTVREEHLFKQARRGRPGAETPYRKITKRRFDIEWTTNQEAIACDHKSDGMYPLITNDRAMSAAEAFQAHKGQPMIEKRFARIKTVHEIAPVLLKNEGRIEALFTIYFIALPVQALIEHELRLAMKREKIAELPPYPEQRQCARPTTEQILRLFTSPSGTR
jgi:hypothetical protein